MRLCALIILCLSFITRAWSAPLDVHEFKLNNGLRLLVKEDHRAPVALVMVWYKVGSAYEHLGHTGISHALEHMMFKGTHTHKTGEYFKIIASNGGDTNANTGRDYTVFYTELAADRLPIIFQLEADRMRNLSLDAQEFNKEIQVIKEERSMRTDDNPQGLTYERFNAAAYLATPYHHPVIGWPIDLKTMTIQDLRDWYKTWYAPNNALIVIVGDVSPQQTYQLVEKYFGALPSTTLPVLKPVAEPANLGLRSIEVKAPAKVPWLLMGYQVPVLNTASTQQDVYALTLIMNILDGGDSSRFKQHLIRNQQIATDADAAYSPFSLYTEQFLLEGTPANGYTILDVKNAFAQEIKNLQTNLVTTDELNRIKTQLTAQKTYEQDSLSGLGMQIGSLESVGLSWRTTDEFMRGIQSITPEQIRTVARKYFIDDRLTVAVLNPLPLQNEKLETQTLAPGVNNVR